MWRYRDGEALEVWKGSDGALLEPPAVSHDGRGVAIVLRRNGKVQLRVITADGGELQPVGESINIRGAADWSPDGKWIVAGGTDMQGPGLFEIPSTGGAPVRLANGPASNPAWSYDGGVIVLTARMSGGMLHC